MAPALESVSPLTVFNVRGFSLEIEEAIEHNNFHKTIYKSVGDLTTLRPLINAKQPFSRCLNEASFNPLSATFTVPLIK